mgnify:CR=1 FL=1
MPYVKRDQGGAIIGWARQPQEGWVVEHLPDNDAEIVAFNTPRVLPSEPTLREVYDALKAKIKGDPTADNKLVDVDSKFSAVDKDVMSKRKQ